MYTKRKSKFKKVKWLFGKEIEIPEEWVFEKISDNYTLKGRIGWQGLTTAEYKTDGKFYLVTGTDFKNGRIDWKNCVYVDEERYVQDKNIQLKVEDVLVTKDGTIGKIAYLNNILIPSTLNSGVFVLRPINKKHSPLFLFYIVSSDWFNKFLNKLKAGSTINHLYQKDFIQFSFPVPSTYEQQKIASILSGVDALIESTQKLIEKTERLKKGLMQKLLTEGIGHLDFKTTQLQPPYLSIQKPEQWEIICIKELCQIKGGKRIPKGKQFSETKTNYPYIRVEDFKNNSVNMEKLKYIDNEIQEKIKSYTISKNDVYISIAGTIGLVGTIPKILDGSNLTENAVKLIIKDKNKILPKFLVLALLSRYVRIQFTSFIGAVSIQKLALHRIEKCQISLPPISEQQKIASILSGIDAYIQKNKNTRKD